MRAFFAGVNCGGCRIVARDATFRDNVNGIYAPLSGTLNAKRVTVSDNAEMGIWTHRLRVTDVEASRNGLAGVAANQGMALLRVEAAENGREGVRCLGFECGRTQIADSTVTGNDTAGARHDIASTGKVSRETASMPAICSSPCSRGRRTRRRRRDGRAPGRGGCHYFASSTPMMLMGNGF